MLSLASALNTGASLFKTFLIKASAFFIASAVLVTITFLSLKRAVSTFLSAATIIPTASFISFAVRLFLIPSAPLVSTLTSTPNFSPASFNAASAIYVCAIPVGQAVTARILFLFVTCVSLTSSLGVSCGFSEYLSTKA